MSSSPVIPAEAYETCPSACAANNHPGAEHGREHVIDGGSCWCGPSVEFVGDGHIVIHNQEPL